MGDIILVLFIALGILIVIFLVLREMVCWYWKINDIVSLLKSIEAKLSINYNQSREILAHDYKKEPINSNTNNYTGTTIETESDLMKKYGITYEDDKYIYKTYKYDVLENAINYAKLCEERERSKY